ncbi:flowering time control protein FCA-like isoform X2 [Tasmannia lanceolata]|uniref:flowering time control protein FCA-like isoform X2 n=1 Tax=Tasmannia lanceolata TaxID=3420 RepID=UPI004062B8F2
MHYRSSDDSPPFNPPQRYPSNPQSSFSEGKNPFNRSQNYPPGGSGGFSDKSPFSSSQNYPPGGPGFRPMSGGYGGGQIMPMAGQKRSSSGFSDSGRGFSPDKADSSNVAKLFIGAVPRTATEEDIRPLFEEHGDVLEVALIRDKRTGQQQGFCFIKYATSEEADRAIRALHNQYTLPGGLGPIQVRYADGERERLGAVEYKLFVGSLNRQATEKEIEEIFSPYGRVEDVYIMRDERKQSRCGFVKFSHKDMAAAAINALNGTYVMRGCDQPLIVRFADPKRPRGGESRLGPSFGGPGFGPRSQAPPGVRPTPNLGDTLVGGNPPNAWHPMSSRSAGPPSQVNTPAFESQFTSRGGLGAISSTASGSLGVLGGPTNDSLQRIADTPSSTSEQSFNPFQSIGQKISPLQKPLQSPQHLPSSLQLYQQQTPSSFSQTPTSQASINPLGQLQLPHSQGQNSFNQALSTPQVLGFSGPLSVSQSLPHQGSSAGAQQNPSNLQPHGLAAAANQHQLPSSFLQPQLLLPNQKLPSQIPQALQSSFQSSQHAFSQLQQQLNIMQPSTQSLSQQPSSQTSKPQSPWNIPQIVVSAPATAPAAVARASISSVSTPVIPVSTQAAAPLTCNWTEHTSPEGYKYYYNSVTSESKWEKPEELTLFEQQQQQQKVQQVQLVPQLQTQLHTQIQSVHQPSQLQQLQFQSQLRQQQMQFQQPSLSLSASSVTGQQNIPELGYAQLQTTNISGIDPARIQQGLQAAQEWIWKNKPSGA